MGLFDYFTKEGKLKRHIQRMSNRDALPEDREASIFWLTDHGGDQAIMGLLSRFDMNLTANLLDSKEKDLVYSTLIQLGEPVHRPLQAWLRQCKQPSVPLRMFEEMSGTEATTTVVLKQLQAEIDRDDFKTEKKKVFLVWLCERKDPRFIDAAAAALSDFDEDVRFCAVEVIAAQESDAGREPLLAALLNPDEESNRLPNRICEVFASRRWSVSGVEIPNIPSGFEHDGERIVRAAR